MQVACTSTSAHVRLVARKGFDKSTAQEPRRQRIPIHHVINQAPVTPLRQHTHTTTHSNAMQLARATSFQGQARAQLSSMENCSLAALRISSGLDSVYIERTGADTGDTHTGGKAGAAQAEGRRRAGRGQ